MSGTRIEFTSTTSCSCAFRAGHADVARETETFQCDRLHVDPKHIHQAMQLILSALTAGNQADQAALRESEIASQFPALLLVKGSDMIDRRPVRSPSLQDGLKNQSTTSDSRFCFFAVCQTEGSDALLWRK